MINPFEILENKLNNIESLLLELKYKSQPKEKPDRCTFEEALEVTGLSKSKLYKLTSASQIPFKRYGKKLIFSRKELLNWVSEHTIDEQDYSGSHLAVAKSASAKKSEHATKIRTKS